MRTLITTGIGVLALGTTMFGAAAAMAQSSASTYSYGTYNPVQAAINRDSMNAALLRQATGGKSSSARHAKRRIVAHRHR
jgi:hypothetical protein